MHKASVDTRGVSASCLNTNLKKSSWYDCKTHIIHATSHNCSVEKPALEPFSRNLVRMSVLTAWQSVSCCTLHLEKARSTRRMSEALSSRTFVHKTCAAEANKSACTKRISDKMVSKAARGAAPKVRCLASTDRPTAEKNFWSACPSAKNPARQQLISSGAISINRDGSSAKAAAENSRENSEKRSRESTFHIRKALMSCASCMLVHSRTLAARSRLISARNSPWYMPIMRSIFVRSSAICSGGRVGSFIKTVLPTSSISAGVDAVMTRCSRAPSHSAAAAPLPSAACGGACAKAGGGAWPGT
mmetsp:Transcript_10967/g.31210  ORF Transcript_10967/g.31210 Transcript_10967/m.31210 type:complete len:303 (-) Transcript_10967:17-925(-)